MEECRTDVKLLAALLCLVLLGCASNLTEAEKAQKKYESEDRYARKLEQFYILKEQCREPIWVLDPSTQYRRTGVPTKWDLLSVSCGYPIWML